MTLLLLYIQNESLVRETEKARIEKCLQAGLSPYWLSLSSPSAEDLEWLGSNWGFHPLTLEDCQVENPRPKLEEYAGYLFLVLHELSLGKEGVEPHDLQVYISGNYLITVQKEPLEAVDKTLEAATALAKGADFLLYRLLNFLEEDYLELLVEMDDRIERLEEQVVAGPSPQTIQRLFRLRHDLVSLLKLAAPFREVLNQLNSHEYQYLAPNHQPYFRDAYNTMVLVHEMIETQRDLASGALEIYLSAVSNNLSEVMKRLTLIATIFMPLSFIAGLWGMNFELLPFRSPLVMWSTLALIILLPLAMLGWFRAKGWV